MAHLHLFNPEHDIVLASGCRSKMNGIPKAALRLRRDLGFLPAFWASDGDYVLVDDVAVAEAAAAPWADYLPEVRFLSAGSLRDLLADAPDSLVPSPWGWDADVRARLAEAGMVTSLMPDDEALSRLRQMSSRAATVALLSETVSAVGVAVGERQVARSMAEVLRLTGCRPSSVVKSPWSSSGRGVRFIGRTLSESEEGFVRHCIEQQGCVVVEPCYERVLDFALEYEVHRSAEPSFVGLSVFENSGTGYVGGMLASEDDKWALLRSHFPDDVWRRTESSLVRWLGSLSCYDGPAGVDMMLVRTSEGLRLHPVVEVNLRRTMGHAAIAVYARTHGRFSRMRIGYDRGSYQLQLTSI